MSTVDPAARLRGRHLWHGRRRLRHVQHLDHGGVCYRRRRSAGCQAWEPLGDVEMRLGGPPRRTGRRHRALASGRCSLRERGRDWVHVCPGVPSGDAVRRSDPARDRNSYRLQYPGTADEPCRGATPAHRCRSSRDCAEAWPRRLSRLGSARAVLVHAEEGLDELGLSGPSTVTEYDARVGDVRTYRISPEEVGLGVPQQPGALAGGDVVENTRITLAILSGESGTAARCDADQCRRRNLCGGSRCFDRRGRRAWRGRH